MRSTGTFNFAATFEPEISAPLDSRSVVTEIGDLTLSGTWANDDDMMYLYSGLTVSVTDSDPLCAGLYMLNDASGFTDSTNWEKIGNAGTGIVECSGFADPNDVLIVEISDIPTIPNQNMLYYLNTSVTHPTFGKFPIGYYNYNLINMGWSCVSHKDAVTLSPWSGDTTISLISGVDYSVSVSSVTSLNITLKNIGTVKIFISNPSSSIIPEPTVMGPVSIYKRNPSYVVLDPTTKSILTITNTGDYYIWSLDSIG